MGQNFRHWGLNWTGPSKAYDYSKSKQETKSNKNTLSEVKVLNLRKC